MNTNSKILVTGGAGFIGSHLCQKLLAAGCEVRVIDDLSTGSIGNIAQFKNNKKFEFIEGTVRDEKIMNELILRCDTVYHLAAAVGVNLIVEKPVHTIKTNIHGTEVVLAAANEFKKKVLLTSTSEVYGKNESVPFSEDDDSVLGSTKHSRWSYACSKAIDEFLALAYNNQYNLPVVIVRLFNTIGPGQSGQYGMVVPRFVERALKNEPLLIYGTGRQSRCFSYVEDIVEAMVRLMASDKNEGQVFNVGSDEEITIEELADRIIEKTDSRSKKKFVSYKNAYGVDFDDMMRRVPSLKKLREAAGFRPQTSLDEVLDIIIADIRVKLG